MSTKVIALLNHKGGAACLPCFSWPQEQDKGIDLLSTVKDAEYVTVFVLGMQVKSGTSYALAEGGRIPVREHGHYWRTSTLPIFVCTVVDSGIFVEDAFAVLSIEPNATLIPRKSELSLSTQHLRLRARVQALVPDLAPTLRATSRRVVANNSFAELCDTYAEMG